jgi:hypothetical protein
MHNWFTSRLSSVGSWVFDAHRFRIYGRNFINLVGGKYPSGNIREEFFGGLWFQGTEMPESRA